LEVVWRVAIVGIDGSGKTTTALRLVERLAERMVVCQPGRPSVVASEGRLRTFLPEAARSMEQQLRRADRTGSKLRVALSRRRYLAYVTRIERLMVRRFRPELLLVARCPIIDPAVYAAFYLPRAARALSLERRLTLAELTARVPPRDLYFLLDTPVDVAMERIHRRVAAAEGEAGREHWLHLHERPEVLRELAGGLRRALELVQARSGARVVAVDNAVMRQDGVVELIAERVLFLARGGRAARGTRALDGRARSIPLPGPGGRLDLPLEAGPSPGRDQVALVRQGSRVVVLLGADGLVAYVVDAEAGVASGPHLLEPDAVTRVVSLTPVEESGGCWVVYTAPGEEGTEVRLARVEAGGGSGPGLAGSTLVRGAVAAGAWGACPDGEVRALVAYAEPSRTEVWGLWVGEDARLRGVPFLVAATDEGELLCRGAGQGRIAVGFDTGNRAWTVAYAAYRGELTRHRAVTVEAGGRVHAPRAVEPPADEEGDLLRTTRVGAVDVTVLRGSPPRLRLEGVA
jgi:thymidylate kinase